MLFQVLCWRKQLLPDLWKICYCLSKFSVKFSVNFRKYFADFMKTVLFVQKYCEKWIALPKLFILAVSCKYSFESLITFYRLLRMWPPSVYSQAGLVLWATCFKEISENLSVINLLLIMFNDTIIWMAKLIIGSLHNINSVIPVL